MPPDRSQGVFETLLVRDGRVDALAQHLQRLAASARALYGYSLPDELAAQVRERAADLTGSHRLRVDLVPGGEDGAQLWLLTSALGARSPGLPEAVVLAPAVVAGGLGEHKWRDRSLLERLRGDGSTVPLLLDEHGRVLEAEWANVWVVVGARLRTPPADGRLLPGVTRARLLELAPGLGLPAEEAPLSLDDLRAADAVFLTSSLRLVTPAGLEPGADARGPAGEVLQRLHDALAAARLHRSQSW